MRISKIIGITLLVSCVTAPGFAAAVRRTERPPARTPTVYNGMLGQYPLSREGSGTSWQPDSSPLEGLHVQDERQMLMFGGFMYGVNDHQGSNRGGDKNYISNLTVIALQENMRRTTLGFRAGFSLDPLSGNDGYPLLLQTGGTHDGQPLIDRQYPQDFFSELSVSFSVPFSGKRSLFLYAGLPGEPALGPPVYLQRFSGMNNPAAPISYQWIDATHVTFGVLTLGYVADILKLESSVFRGRGPDENHWDIETGKMDSYSFRLSCNVTQNWSAQASYGMIASPDELAPDVDIDRYTASVIYNRSYREADRQVTVAWGLNDNHPGRPLNAFLLESAFAFNRLHCVFFRVEDVEKDNLFLPGDPLSGRIFSVNKGSLGYIFNFPAWVNLQFGIGAMASVSVTPTDLIPVYGDAPFSYMFFARARLVEK